MLLNHLVEFENVPKTAITMGVSTILKAKRIVLIAWGENKSEMVVYESIESSDNLTERITASFLQIHKNATFVLDNGSASRIN